MEIISFPPDISSCWSFSTMFPRVLQRVPYFQVRGYRHQHHLFHHQHHSTCRATSSATRRSYPTRRTYIPSRITIICCCWVLSNTWTCFAGTISSIGSVRSTCTSIPLDGSLLYNHHRHHQVHED